jgi:hypothetical protein
MRIVRKVAVSGAMNVRPANNVRVVNARIDRPRGKIALPVCRAKSHMAVVRGVTNVAAKKVVARSAHVRTVPERNGLAKTGRAVKTDRDAKNILPARIVLAETWSVRRRPPAT